MNSPVTGRPMREIEYEGATIHTCDDSGGEFIGPEALAHIVRTQEEQFEETLHQALADSNPRAGIDASEIERQFSCPGCGGQMHIINYAGDSGVHLDRCHECGGVWLDHHELEKIQILMENWRAAAPEQIEAIAGELAHARELNEAHINSAFSGSRFAFVNAIINRFLDAA